MKREPDFYERNIGKPVDLFTREATVSGDIKCYNRDKGVVILSNSIQRVYYNDGTSEYVEFPYEFEIDVSIVHMRKQSTKEDRLGRITCYNKDLQIEIEERKRKVSVLEEKSQK